MLLCEKGNGVINDAWDSESSRSVCSNIAEAWRKRRYEPAFISKLNDSEAEAAETQTWLEFAVKCGYTVGDQAQELQQIYDCIIGKLVNMIRKPSPWILPKPGSNKISEQETSYE